MGHYFLDTQYKGCRHDPCQYPRDPWSPLERPKYIWES